VPIADQRTLFDLTARGERAIAAAGSNATAALEINVLAHADPTEIVVVAPAGVGGDFEARLFDTSTPEALSRATWGAPEDTSVEGRFSVWAQDHVGVRRARETPYSARYRGIEGGVVVTRNGVVAISRGYVPGDHVLGPLEDRELRSEFTKAFAAAREILNDYGGHGDLRLAYKVDDLRGRGLMLRDRVIDAANFPEPLVVEIDTGFDDETAEERVFAEVLRAAGVGPPAPDANP
jgi:hypothetical protein